MSELYNDIHKPVVLKSTINMNIEELEKLRNFIIESKEKGVVILPDYLDELYNKPLSSVTQTADSITCAIQADPHPKRGMTVQRSQVIVTSNFVLGDKIEVKLDGLGVFLATAHKILSDEVLFIFDDCICERSMNEENTNKGGYEYSDLAKYLKEEILLAFPDNIRPRIKDLTIPTYGQIFGHDDFYDRFEPDHDEQLPLMAYRKNRIALYNDDPEWYWLQNPTKKTVSASSFAYVGSLGFASHSVASGSLGVRPAFLLAKD